ncbi:MAG: hypothetical protein KC613_14720, partial [Myxococcales bacterium]|nr:hypothetical protein [Myxococcales bacterium]
SLTALVAQAGGEGPELHARLALAKPPAWVTPPAPRPHPLPTLAELLADPTAIRADQVLKLLGELNDEDRETGARILGVDPATARGEGVREAIAAADAEDFEARMRLPLVRWAADALGTRVRRLKPQEFAGFADAIEGIQIASYEPARRDSLAYLGTLLDVKGGLVLVAEDPKGLVGIAAGGPLELWPDLDGPRQDVHRGRHDTFYSADITVAPRGRGHGLGLRMRAELIKAALQLRGEKGRPRYAYITGRNRIGAADSMWAINQRFGAYAVAEYAGQYGSPDGRTRYYRIPLRRGDRRAFAAPSPTATRLEMGQGVSMPTGLAHPLLTRARDLGVFDEAALTKLTVSNFITRPYARYAEYLRHVAPKGNPHLYFTSCNDEMVDKSLRVLKHKREDGRLAIGLQGGYLGNTTAAARSLSDPAGNSPRHGFFGWPLVPHPSRDISACIAALDALVAEHGADAVLGVYVESVQALTGEVMTAQAWQALCAWRDRTGVPLVLSENTTGMYRNAQRRFWWVDSVAGSADMVLWWAGGQIGHVFASDDAFVDKPLSFISTWDGDELSA